VKKNTAGAEGGYIKQLFWFLNRIKWEDSLKGGGMERQGMDSVAGEEGLSPLNAGRNLLRGPDKNVTGKMSMSNKPGKEGTVVGKKLNLLHRDPLTRVTDR